jgi:hypothetical protein
MFLTSFLKSTFTNRSNVRRRFRANSEDPDARSFDSPAARRQPLESSTEYAKKMSRFWNSPGTSGKHGLPVPEIYIEDPERSAYLEEDLGHHAFPVPVETAPLKALPEVIDIYRKTVSRCRAFKSKPGDLDYSVCYPRDSFDRQSIS